MKISLSSVLLFALATESTVASSWFGGATKAGQYSSHFCNPAVSISPETNAVSGTLNNIHLRHNELHLDSYIIHQSYIAMHVYAYSLTS